MFILSKKALMIIDSLEKAGYEAFAVGGCVRDMLMGREVNDIDITTNALPEEIKEVFSDFRVLDVGIKHGTVTVIIDHTPIEITTYRQEKGYSDSRHPDKVTFTTKLEDDLSRRDFTVNAIAYNPRRGIVDPFGGRQDIENKIIRCVGDPETRFKEDALRILRGLRFSSTLGFIPEKETARAIINLRELTHKLSSERVYSELCKMLCGKDIKRVLLTYTEAIEEVLPEIKNMKGFDQRNYHHIHDILTHTAVVLESIESSPDLRLAALFHDCSKPDCFTLDSEGVGHFYSHASISAKKAEAALIRLKSDKATREKVTRLVKLHDSPIEPREAVIKKKLSKYGQELFFDLIKLQRADNLGLSPQYHHRQKTYDEIERTAKKIISESQCFSLKDLAVNGNDMLALGLKGKQTGDALKALLAAVMEEKAENTKESLIKYYHNYVKNK